MTAVATPPPKSVEPDVAPPAPEEPRSVPRWIYVIGVLIVWVVIYQFTKGQDTLYLAHADNTRLHDDLTDFGSDLGGSTITEGIASAINSAVDWLRYLIASPDPAGFRPAPTIGWLGVIAIATWIGYAAANLRIAALVLASFLAFGAFGFWAESMDLLAITVVSVAITVVIGFPLAIWMGLSARAARAITLVIDLLQTMPTFVYLIFVVILFGIGAPTAVVCTLLYALPPIVRIAGFGIRDVSGAVIEATDSAGQTTWQRLVKVQIPMARSTIILGLNQTILAALSMAIIAAFINGPGLGIPVYQALSANDFGGGLVPGCLIVLMGIMLDRLTTAASQRSEVVARGGGGNVRNRRIGLGLGLVGVAGAVWYSRYSLDAALFPQLSWGDATADKTNEWMGAVTDATSGLTGWFKDTVTNGLINPLQDLLANSPWWLAFGALFVIALLVGGSRALAPTVLCLTGLRVLDLWNFSMVVLNMTIVATILVMILAVIFGVMMARSRAADLLLRPILDAGQTMPAFVYLIPALALFGPSRFTAIVAGVIYAAPAAIKLVADGVNGVSTNTVESGRSVGSTTWQEITKIQLPMAKGALVLATNQGLLYVLSMVVIGGFVGAGALGYDVNQGLGDGANYFGKGLAAGLSIVLLGIFIDRVARAAAERAGAGHAGRERAFKIGGWRPALFTQLSGPGRF